MDIIIAKGQFLLSKVFIYYLYFSLLNSNFSLRIVSVIPDGKRNTAIRTKSKYD